MKKWKTQNGSEIFQVLNRRSNSYLICNDFGNLLVDTGTRKSFHRLICNLDSPELKPGKIDYLVLTHTHFDHCQNAFSLKENTGCRIVMSKNEAIYSGEGYTPLPGGTSWLTRQIAKGGRKIGKARFGFTPFIPDVLVEEKLDLDINNRTVSIIHTPGHSAGSISVIVDEEFALVGDSLFGVFRKSILPPFADNPEDLVNSWGLLLKTSCQKFLPGHGDEITRDRLQSEYDKHIVIRKNPIEPAKRKALGPANFRT